MTWEKKRIEESIQRFCDQFTDSKSVANVVLAHLVSFFFVNGFRVGKNCSLELDSYYVPSRYRKTKEYVPTEDEIKKMVSVGGVSLRDRVAILLLYQAGLRNSTLRWKDIDLDNNEGEPLYIPIYPEMKEIEPDACKGSIPYFSFVGNEAIEALKLYREEIKNKYGIKPNQIIIMSNSRLMDIETKRFSPIIKKSLVVIVKKASKNCGIKDWNSIHPHTFRKAYERALRNSGLDVKSQEFLMGHILPNSQDAYYERNIEELREKYEKIVFFHTPDKMINGLHSQLFEAEQKINELQNEKTKREQLEQNLVELMQRISTLEEKI